MPEHHDPDKLYMRVIVGHTLSDTDLEHAETCPDCRRALSDARSFDHRLQGSARLLVGQPLPTEISRPDLERPRIPHWKVAATLAAGVLVAAILGFALGPLRLPAPVGQGTESPVASTPPVEPSPHTPEPASITGLQLIIDPALSPGSILDTAFDGTTIVAAGQSCAPDATCHAALWSSDDGVSWRRVETFPSAGATEVTAIATGSAGWIALGSGVAWFSQDGERWGTVEVGNAFDGLADGGPSLDAEGGGCGTVVRDVDASDEGYVAIGAVTCSKCRGRAAVWSSPDGHSWQRVSYSSQLEGGPMMALGALPTGRLVAVGGSAWISDDGGRAWRRTADAFGNSLARAVAVFDDRIVAVGSDADSGDGSIWASSDGMTWETAVADGEIFSGVELGAVTSLGDSLVVAGRRSDPQGLHESPVSAVTKDLADWQVVEVSPSAGRINSLLHTGMRLLAVGVSDLDAPNGQQPAGVWTLR